MRKLKKASKKQLDITDRGYKIIAKPSKPNFDNCGYESIKPLCDGEIELLLKLEKAVYGWFYKTSDDRGDDGEKMAKYQGKMAKMLKKLNKVRAYDREK